MVGVESTVLDITGKIPRLLRPGGVAPEELRKIIGELLVDPAVYGEMQAARASSPGMKYKHYAPRAEVSIVKGDLKTFQVYVNQQNAPGVYALCFTGEESQLVPPCVSYGREDDAEQQARELFHALRELDRLGAQKVYARCPSQEGVGLAVFNRLQRAAAFRIIDPEEA